MDPILTSLQPSLLAFVEDQLSNNEVSSDQELLDHFVQNGLTQMQAQLALTYRNLYLNNIFIADLTPIRVGDQALRFSSHLRWIEPI